MCDSTVTTTEAPTAGFSTKDDALEWMYETVNDPYIDNVRMAFADDAEEMAAYKEAEKNGCCGRFDDLVLIKDRRMWIGCNYGH